MAYDQPKFCKLEHWDPSTREWVVRQAGVNLLYPIRYCERLADKGKIGRVTVMKEGTISEVAEVLQTMELPDPEQPVWCPMCEDTHVAPFDGSCLL